MTEYEAVQANLMAVVRITDDLQRSVNELTHVCKVQDETINSLIQRVVDLEDAICDERLTAVEDWLKYNGWKIEDGR